jgi:hypothetical protein
MRFLCSFALFARPASCPFVLGGEIMAGDRAERGGDMAGQVLHQPRLAWDGARVIVRVADSGHLYGWLSEQIGRVLGPAYRQALFDSRNRLWSTGRPDAPQVEAGLWRARLEDALRANPDLVAPLRELIHEAGTRLAAAA